MISDVECACSTNGWVDDRCKKKGNFFVLHSVRHCVTILLFAVGSCSLAVKTVKTGCGSSYQQKTGCGSGSDPQKTPGSATLSANKFSCVLI